MKLFQLLSFIVIIAATSCSKPSTRKVLVMGRGNLTASENKITMKDGTGYAEQLVQVEGNEAVDYEVNTPSGKRTVTIPADPGFYMLNLKVDTLVGSEQKLGVDIGGGVTITQEDLKRKIDSLSQLVIGSNMSPAGGVFLVLPDQLLKVSVNMEAKVFGPFTLVSRELEVDKNGKQPEVYKFYTFTEMRQLIEKFKKMTTAAE
jgi:hypothetical protein